MAREDAMALAVSSSMSEKNNWIIIFVCADCWNAQI